MCINKVDGKKKLPHIYWSFSFFQNLIFCYSDKIIQKVEVASWPMEMKCEKMILKEQSTSDWKKEMKTSWIA